MSSPAGCVDSFASCCYFGHCNPSAYSDPWQYCACACTQCGDDFAMETTCGSENRSLSCTGPPAPPPTHPPSSPTWLCNDDCDLMDFASNGYCQDGGPGAESNQCALGTDCTDCGPRHSVHDCDAPNCAASEVCCACEVSGGGASPTVHTCTQCCAAPPSPPPRPPSGCRLL